VPPECGDFVYLAGIVLVPPPNADTIFVDAEHESVWAASAGGIATRPPASEHDMKAFQVWIRPMVSACRVRVHGMRNARWLLNRLSDSFVFKTSDPLDDDPATACSSFQVQYNSQMSGPKFAKLLAAIPEVSVALEPA